LSKTAVIKSPDFYELRKTALYHFFAFEIPAQSTWEKPDFAAKVMNELLINTSGKTGAIKVLKYCTDATKYNVAYNSNGRYANVVLKTIIKEHDTYDIYREMSVLHESWELALT
jgi:hypothetical protein